MSQEGTRKRFQNKDGGPGLNRQVCGISKFAGSPLPARVNEKPDAAESVGKFLPLQKVPLDQVIEFLESAQALAELGKKRKR